MHFIFFGTPTFASTILNSIAKEGFVPVAVVCNPDKPAGKKKIITQPAVKQYILRNQPSVPVLQPEQLDGQFIQELSRYAPDLFIVAAYAKILRQDILSIPAKGVIGVHPSLLPKYRGMTPIQTALLNGEKETGVTLFFLDEKMDHGPIIKQEVVDIKNEDTYETLLLRLAETSGTALAATLTLLEKSIPSIPQNEKDATYTKKIHSEDAYVPYPLLKKAEKGDLALSSDIYNKIRALNPEPGVYTINEKEKRIKLLAAEKKEGMLVLTKIQEDGKKPRDLT